jgi:hypothetical protein
MKFKYISLLVLVAIGSFLAGRWRGEPAAASSAGPARQVLY